MKRHVYASAIKRLPSSLEHSLPATAPHRSAHTVQPLSWTASEAAWGRQCCPQILSPLLSQYKILKNLSPGLEERSIWKKRHQNWVSKPCDPFGIVKKIATIKSVQTVELAKAMLVSVRNATVCSMVDYKRRQLCEAPIPSVYFSCTL
jgi:hypothetical protein